jgi:stress-induced morphogen
MEGDRLDGRWLVQRQNDLSRHQARLSGASDSFEVEVFSSQFNLEGGVSRCRVCYKGVSEEQL